MFGLKPVVMLAMFQEVRMVLVVVWGICLVLTKTRKQFWSDAFVIPQLFSVVVIKMRDLELVFLYILEIFVSSHFKFVSGCIVAYYYAVAMEL